MFCLILGQEVYNCPKTATTMMQDLDPSRRPGAGPDGYAVLKMHPFFRGVDWKNLRGQTPPKLALEPGVWLPLCVKTAIYKETSLPKHSCLSLIE
jgi:hypothetical protein